jgi:glycosyltransferase involved in cell wall biosynthesis
MKILIVTPYYYPYTSGITRYVQELAENLSYRNHEISVLTYKHDKNLKEYEIINKVKVFRTSFIFKYNRGVFSPFFIIKFIFMMRNYDVINIHAPLPEIGLISILSFLFRKKLVITYHCDFITKYRIFSKLLEPLYLGSLRIATKISKRIIVNSFEYAKNSFIKKRIFKTVEIFPPINIKKFRKTNPNNFRKKYGISPKEKIIGFVGRLTFEKGLNYLISAIPEINKKIKNVKVVIVGGGEKEIAGGKSESVRNKILGMINHLKINNVILTGFLDDKSLIDFYSACDVFVLPSINPMESFGMVQVEAMFCGVPVVTSNLYGVNLPIKLTGMGLLFTPGDSKQLAKAIMTILQKKRKFIKPRKKLMKIFNLNDTLKKYEKIFVS